MRVTIAVSIIHIRMLPLLNMCYACQLLVIMYVACNMNAPEQSKQLCALPITTIYANTHIYSNHATIIHQFKSHRFSFTIDYGGRISQADIGEPRDTEHHA